MLKIVNVSKIYPTRFGEKLVLDNISFDLAMGEHLGFFGRNGAGKSTLIRVVSGAERPTSGSVTSTMSVSWPLAFGGAFHPQLTGVDNIRFISRVYGQDFERNLAFVEEFAEIGPYLREPVQSYSSGMRARLAFAISMIIEFDCFLIDEIASVGDARFHERCNHELFEKRGDRAMIIVSHDPGYLRDHCNRWAVLVNGRMIAFTDFDEAQDYFLHTLSMREKRPVATMPISKRIPALDALRRMAYDDEQFMVLVRRADAARDKRNWAEAQKHYGLALALHPFERTYWVQLGHVAREQGKTVIAEIAYRTACAYGEPSREIAPFMAAVARMQSEALDKSLNAPDDGDIAKQPPGYPDLSLFWALVHGDAEIDDEAALTLLRTSDSLETMLAALLENRPRHRKEIVLPQAITMVPGQTPKCADWVEDLTRVSGAQAADFRKALAKGGDPLVILRNCGGFAGWRIPVSTPEKEVQT